MKLQILALFALLFFAISCNSDDTNNSDFDRIIGTYAGASTYSYVGLPNGVLVQNQDAGPATLTVSVVSRADMTFNISGTALLTEAFTGYGDGIYTWDVSKLSGNLYFATNTDNLPEGLREISSRFNIVDGTVKMDYDGRVDSDASVTNISFEGTK